jgi:hypothetical protein
MTAIATSIGGVLAAGVLAAGTLFGGGSDSQAGRGSHLAAQTGLAVARTAIVIDASLASHGRDLVDDRLERLGAEVRLPRDRFEAATDVRYFDRLGYTVVVAGDRATRAAEDAGEPAVYAGSVGAAVAALTGGR